MEVRIQHLGDVKFQATARDHRVICDQPASNGGSDTGMTPPEFILAALGTCAGYYAAQYLKNHSQPTDGLEILVSAEKLKAPSRLGNFRIEVIAPGLDAAQQDGLLRAVKACPVHNTLSHPSAVEAVVNAAIREPALA
jgi:putative redox protein